MLRSVARTVRPRSGCSGGRWVPVLVALLASGVGCSTVPGGDDRGAARYQGLLGSYRGSFDSALTEDPADDLNYNPCDPRLQSCTSHHDPLVDVLLVLQADAAGRLRAVFYRDVQDRATGKPLDLLGGGCGTELGPAESADRGTRAGEPRWTAVFPLTVENRLCLGKLRPTSRHSVVVTARDDEVSGTTSLEVSIDKAVVSEDYLYVKEKGVERRVRIRPANTVGEGRQARYQVCIEDDLGEFDRCVLTDKELKQFFLPVPLPGGVAASYTWWHDLEPDLRRTRGLYRLEQYTGRFDPLED